MFFYPYKIRMSTLLDEGRELRVQAGLGESNKLPVNDECAGIHLGGFISNTRPPTYEVIQKQDGSRLAQQHHLGPKCFPPLCETVSIMSVSSPRGCEVMTTAVPGVTHKHNCVLPKKGGVFLLPISLCYGEKLGVPDRLSLRSPALHGSPPPPPLPTSHPL